MRRPLVSASFSDADEAFSQTDIEKRLNSSAKREVSLVCSRLGFDFDGRARRIVFHSDVLLFLLERI